MSRAPTGGDSDSDEDMDKEYQIELLYHAADAADGEVQAERLRVDAKSTWPDVKKFAQQRSGHADFALEDEDGGRLGAQTPLAWIRADQQGRPYRRAVVKRRGVDADGVFERRGVVAPAHVGLVANTINAGMDTTTLLSESIENSVQHGATLVKIFIEPEARRIVVFDNGDGIRPEHIDVLAKAGASTVRDDEIQAPVRGALLAHEAGGGRGGRSQGSRGSAYSHREFGRLKAEWGRYGVGRYAQLNGTETKVRFVSVAKGVTKLVVFEQDMAEMAHQKTITYDYHVYDHGTRECARAINDVNKLVRDDPDPTYQPSPDDPDALDQFLRKRGVGDQSFTCLTIDKVDAGFFDDWAANRAENLALLAEKYVLHLDGNAGEASRSWLRACGVLPAEDANARIVKLKVDGVDLGESGEMSERDVGVANRFADLARLADLREAFEQKRHLDRWVLREEGHSTARAELAALSVYFPQENGMDTMPEGVREHRTLVLWNGLFLRDEAIAAWPYAAPRNHRGQVAPGDAKLDKRCVTVLYLESTRLFAPEIHKRHLRPHDAAYKRLADEPPAGDDFTRDLRNAHRDRLRRWTEEFDEEERYPMEAGSYDFVQYGAGQNVTYRRVGKSLLYRSDRYQVGDIVRFALTEEKRREDQSLGAGRIVAFICDAEQTNTSGFFICSSVLAPRDDAAGQAFVMDFSQRGADLAALEAAGPARWSRDLYVACPSNRLRGAKLGADGVKAALDDAKKQFPAKVQLVECGTTKLKPAETKLAAEPFTRFDRTLYTSTPVPEFAFTLLAFNAKTKALDAKACADIELELVARPPSGAEDWSDAVVVAAGGCDAGGVFRLAKPEPLDEMGEWQFRARLRETPNAVWTALANWERASSEERKQVKKKDRPKFSLDTLARRDDDALAGLQGSEPPFSRAVECKLNPSEPVQLTCSLPRRSEVHLDATIADLSVTFQDSLDQTAADAQQRVSPKDYDVTGEHSRAWIEVEGREPFALDLSACRLARCRGDGALSLDNLVVPAEAVPADVLLPAAAELHLELHPVVDGEYEYVTYVADVVAGRTQASPRRVFRALDKTFQSLVELEQHVNMQDNKWLVPRTVAPLALTLTSAPAKLSLRDERALMDLERPFIATCVFELVTASGHFIDAKAVPMGAAVVGDGSVNITHHGAAENNDDGSVTQSYLIDGADLGWSGQVRFDVDDTLFLMAEASTGDKNVRVSVLTQTGDAVEEEVDAASPGWVACAEDARHRVALGALDLAEVGATHLRVEVVDGAGAVDARACGASQAWLVLNSPDGAKHKTKVCAPVLDGVAVLELGRLASSTSRGIKEQREAGKFSFQIVFKNSENKDVLTSRGISLPLKAGAPDSVDVDDEAFQALLDAGDDRGLLTLGKPAPYLCLVVRDEAGTRLESEQLAGLAATLTCADACHTLREAPTDAPIDGSSMTDAEPGALPGGWSVLSGWDAPPEVEEGARGWPIKFRLALAGGDVRLETSFELPFRNGPLAEVQAVALPGGVLSVEVGEIVQIEDCFSLKDESGNPFRDDPTADAAPRGPMFDVAIECDAPGLDLELQRVGTKKPKKGKGKKKKAPAADAPEPETAGAVVVPVGAALETLTIPECRVAVAGGELSEVVEAKLVLRARAECPADAAALQLDFIPISVAPSSKVRTLEIFKREKDQVGAEDGEVPAVGADPQAMGLDQLSNGETLEVPTGRSVLDVLQLSGMCEDGQLATRDEERRENFRGDLRWHQGENDPNSKGWKKIDKLAQVDPSWFCKLMPDETRPIRFAVIDGDTGSVETFTTLTLKRVAGQAQRITFKEADTDDTDDGERGASARYEAEACDSLANSAHRCACAARLTTSTTNDADDDLANLCQLEVRRWVKGSDPADATVDLLSLDANDVAVALEETDATFIEVRLVDATNNKQPIEDLRVSLAMKIYPQNGEDDVDGQLNVARTVELRLENELGRAAREAKTEGERAAQVEYDRARAAVTAQRQAVEGLVDEQRDYQRAVERAASKEDARRALEAARQATAAAEAARKAAEDAEEAPLAREHRFSSDPQTHEKLRTFRAELVRQLHRAGRAPSELRGFTSELATVENDSDADCCAQLAGANKLYVGSSDARVIAQKLAKSGKYGAISVVDVSLAGPSESWNAERHAPVDASDAGFGAVSAVLRLSAQRCDLEQVFRRQIGRALIFPDDERLTAADKARGVAPFKRVSRESPAIVAKTNGQITIGVDARPPPFIFASPGDGQLEAAEKRLRDARAAEDRAEADFEGYADVAEPPASDVEARLAAARAELERLENDKARLKAAKRALAPLDNAEEEAPRKRKETVDVQGSLKKRKVKAKKPAAARKKKRARDADEEPASPKRARDEGDNWEFDGGVDE